jgi:hypothetical protein
MQYDVVFAKTMETFFKIHVHVRLVSELHPVVVIGLEDKEIPLFSHV